jgi:hypothetical protein
MGFLRHQVRGAQQGIERAGIGPPAVQNVILKLAFPDVIVVHVGDFELTARRRLQRFDDVEYLAIVHIDSGHGEFRRRRLRFFVDADDLRTFDLGDSETLRIFHFFEEDPAPCFLKFST